MKIVYVAETMVSTGGTEKMLSEKANYLADHYGYEVTVISCTQTSDQPNTFPLSGKVKQLNLAIPFYRQYHYGYPRRLLVKWQADRELKEQLTKAICQIDPDILIGVARFAADVVSIIPCRAKKVIETHEARYYLLADVEGNRSFLSRQYMNLFKRKRYFRKIEKHADLVVTLTEGDKKLWHKAHRVEVIPNCSSMRVSGYGSYRHKRVIAVGRLSAEKGYDRLLKIWEMVAPQHPEWTLDIFGEGKLHDALNDMIRERRLQNVCIHPPTTHISEEYAKSSICVLTSHFEGFSLVLLEACMHGLPSVAFNCPFGPASIIKDGICGYLISDDDMACYAKKLSLLMDDEASWNAFSTAALQRAHDFSTETVMKRWKQLLESLLHPSH